MCAGAASLVKAGTGAYGYNAASGQLGDMLGEGILDPTRISRLALQNAASVAGQCMGPLWGKYRAIGQHYIVSPAL